jgi:hypothetical protein
VVVPERSRRVVAVGAVRIPSSLAPLRNLPFSHGREGKLYLPTRDHATVGRYSLPSTTGYGLHSMKLYDTYSLSYRGS